MPSPAAVPIAFCITELDFGGAERMFVELVTRLDRRRFSPEVYVLAARPTGDDEVLTRRLEAESVPVHFLGAAKLFDAPRVLGRLEQGFCAQRPVIVQNFLWHANTLGALAARRAGVPHCLSGIRVAEHRRNLHRWVARRTQNFVARHVCVSQAVADFAARQMGLPAERLVVIPNGVDLAQYPAEPANLAGYGLPPDRRALLFVGRLDSQKRVDWLLARLPHIFQAAPQHDLLVVGRGPDQTHLERLARQLGVAARVHFVGWRPEVPALIAASDLLLLTSIAEGMPNVVLEAMASGKPVVATQVQGIDELLGAAAAPQTAPSQDAAQFEAKVIALLNDSQLAAELGAENRARVEAHFTLDQMVRGYEQLYESLLRS